MLDILVLWAWNVVFVCNTESIFLCVSTSQAQPPPLLHITTLTTERGPSVCLSVCHNQELCWNGWTDRDAAWVVDSGGPREPCVRWGPDPPRERGILGKEVVPSLKCIRLCKQQMTAAARGCKLVRRGGAPRRKRGFRMDSPFAWVTSAGAMRPFVKILWLLVDICARAL